MSEQVLEILKDRVIEAAKECEDAAVAFKILFPEVFDELSTKGHEVVVKLDKGAEFVGFVGTRLAEEVRPLNLNPNFRGKVIVLAIDMETGDEERAERNLKAALDERISFSMHGKDID